MRFASVILLSVLMTSATGANAAAEQRDSFARTQNTSLLSLEQVVGLYGEDVVFDVYRNDNRIGSHTVSFAGKDDHLVVTANLRLRVNVLFFTAYRLDYWAHEEWRDGRLLALKAETNDNGKQRRVEARNTDAGFLIESAGRVTELDSWIFPTNHWNRAQVQTDRILNSITGRPADVVVHDRGLESVATAHGDIQARRFEYTGDLRDTHVWYDRRGRWVKMSFKAKDGSWIEYRCARCSGEHPRSEARDT